MIKQTSSFEPQSLQVIRERGQASVLLQGDRRHYLKLLAEPASATNLARRLCTPRQKVNYHLRALEKVRLIRLVGRRQARNCIERVVRATAYRYVISPEVLADLCEEKTVTPNRYSSAYLLAQAARLIRDLGEIRDLAEAAGKPVASFSMQADVRFGSASDRNAFAEELAGVFAHLVKKYHKPATSGGRTFRFLTGAYPALTRPDEGTGDMSEEG